MTLSLTCYPTAATQVNRGYGGWSGQNNIFSDDNSVASGAMTGYDYTDWLIAKSFSPKVPHGSIITGIEAFLKAGGDTTDVKIAQLKIGKNSSDLSADYYTSYVTTYEVLYSSGGASDLWGYSSLSFADVVNDDFCIALYGYNASSGGKKGGGTNSLYIDVAYMKIYYENNVGAILL